MVRKLVCYLFLLTYSLKFFKFRKILIYIFYLNNDLTINIKDIYIYRIFIYILNTVEPRYNDPTRESLIRVRNRKFVI